MKNQCWLINDTATGCTDRWELASPLPDDATLSQAAVNINQAVVAIGGADSDVWGEWGFVPDAWDAATKTLTAKVNTDACWAAEHRLTATLV